MDPIKRKVFQKSQSFFLNLYRAVLIEIFGVVTKSAYLTGFREKPVDVVTFRNCVNVCHVVHP